ncbi:MAG: hypothetical protein GXX96_19655 [Planctomycetaceae bacterium]|nr:hypothetical protein [Planctomycetaceae bacterium]
MLTSSRSAAAALAVAVCCCVLSFYRATDASQRTPNPPKPPFASSVEQRLESINELKAIRDLLKEQNQLIKEQNEILRAAFPGVAQPKKP